MLFFNFFNSKYISPLFFYLLPCLCFIRCSSPAVTIYAPYGSQRRSLFEGVTRQSATRGMSSLAAAVVDQQGEMFGVYKLLSRRACADAGPTHPHYGLR